MTDAGASMRGSSRCWSDLLRDAGGLATAGAGRWTAVRALAAAVPC
ncbi:hypothetical protein [Amycolatopsis sp. NPDC051716]